VEFSFENERPRSSSPSSTNAIGSDRLRKAIERNRAKQAKRSGQAARAAAHDDWSLPGNSSRMSSSSAASVRGTRRSVASADNVEFTTALRKSSRAPAPVNYSEAKTPTVVTRKSTRKVTSTRTSAKPKSKILKNTNEYVIKGIWVFCAILLLRLVFSDGGVRDYYAKKDVLQGRFDELARIEKENRSLVKEIELLRKDPRYQRKVVRDHLGYISQDEYLILFPENM
jgi:cell division protein FtsB